ncbi:hypothetical protein ACFO4O_13690 [Glaciecola siphonariae]|uniref:Lipoprotein n=1 Tax=Glaciecola siphonariae TaxID=521012 RepID=A0ABV9LY50_9ALTE
MTKQIKLPVFAFMALVSSSLLLAGCVIHVGASDDKGGYSYAKERNYSSTNKSVKVAQGVSAGNVSSVNGSVKVEDNASVEEVSNVNGRISIGENVTAADVSVVNGKVSIGKGFTGQGNIETVNGQIKIDSDSSVTGNIETVNGDIELEGVSIGGSVSSTNGDISLLDGSVVNGDVIFEGRPNKNKSWRNKAPTLKVDAGSTIKGKIIIYKDVDFDFADSALMSKVERR